MCCQGERLIKALTTQFVLINLECAEYCLLQRHYYKLVKLLVNFQQKYPSARNPKPDYGNLPAYLGK